MGIACDFWLIFGGGDGGGGGVGRASAFRSTPRASAVGARMPTWCPSRPPTLRAWWGGITTIEGLCRRVAGVSGVYGSNSPRLAVGARRTLCSNCRPPRRKTPKMGCCGRGGLRFEQMGSDMAPPRRCAVPGDGPHPRIFAGASDTSRELPLAQGGGITKPPGARPGGKWSGRRESNPPLKLGKLPFYR